MTLIDERQKSLEPAVVPHPLPILGTAVAVGVAAELALHASIISSAPPGLGIPVALTIGVVGLITGGRRLGLSPDRTTLALYAGAIWFASLTAVRASSPLVTINVISSLGLLGLAVAAHNPLATRPAFLTEFARTAGRLIGAGALGGFLVTGRDLRHVDGWSIEKIRRIGVGFFVALPLLVVFGALFVSADQVFGDAFRSITSFDLPDGLTAGACIAGLIAWVVLGLLRGIVIEPEPEPEAEPGRRRYLGTTEASTAMWLINSLFGSFVAFQIFEVIASYQSADFSYAQQARNGFFQLVTVGAIVVGTVLLLDWSVAPADHRRLHRQQRLLVGLTGVILVSAVVRMATYVDAYGLTRLRVFTTVFMVWIAFLLAWLTRSVLSGSRQDFARPAVAGLLATVLSLNLINPDGLIASYNLTHQPGVAAEIDSAYLYRSLSPDAVPAIVGHIENSGDPCAQLQVVDRINVNESSDIRGWNLSRSRASDLIETAQRELGAACQSG